MRALIKAGISIITATALTLGLGGIANAGTQDSITNNLQTATVNKDCNSDSHADSQLESEIGNTLSAMSRLTNLNDIPLSAQEMYPNNTAKQREYIEFFSDISVDESKDIGFAPRAIPAIVALAIPIVAACVANGIKGAVLDQVVNAIRGQDLGKADDLIWSFVEGCVGWGPIKWAFKAARPVAGRALTWAVEQALKLFRKM